MMYFTRNHGWIEKQEAEVLAYAASLRTMQVRRPSYAKFRPKFAQNVFAALFRSAYNCSTMLQPPAQ
jgi:hypothetical protein